MMDTAKMTIEVILDGLDDVLQDEHVVLGTE